VLHSVFAEEVKSSRNELHDFALSSRQRLVRNTKLSARRTKPNQCILGKTSGRRSPLLVFHSVFVEDVKSSRNEIYDFTFSSRQRLPRRRCETQGLAHVFQTSSLKYNDFVTSALTEANAISRALERSCSVGRGGPEPACVRATWPLGASWAAAAACGEHAERKLRAGRRAPPAQQRQRPRLRLAQSAARRQSR
jgi:hypothetical protein